MKSRYWYFRHNATGVRALPGKPGEPEFHRAYADLLETTRQAPTPKQSDPVERSSLRWLAREYEKSPEFRQLKPLTQRDYGKILGLIVDTAGDVGFATISKRGALALRDRFSATPRRANYVVQVLSLLLTWAADHELIRENPILGIKKLKTIVRGYKPWSEVQIAEFLENCKPHVALGFLLGLYTGQRLSDVVAAAPSQYDGVEILVRQSKTNELLPITVARPLKLALDNRPFPKASRIVVKENGEPYASESSFANALKREIKRLGLDPALSFHGLRYAAAARLEESGCTLGMISSIVGHRTYQMAVHYATKRRSSQAAALVFEAFEALPDTP